ncbi:hypothetical protein PSAC2689_60341 [Paraburkholderia sacchari]
MNWHFNAHDALTDKRYCTGILNNMQTNFMRV